MRGYLSVLINFTDNFDVPMSELKEVKRYQPFSQFGDLSIENN